MKFSFDFDDTLTTTHGFMTACMCSTNHDLYIMSCRSINEDNNDIVKYAESLGIPVTNIIFTNGEDKYKYLDSFDVHYDDDPDEIQKIENYTNCKGILVK